MTIEKSPRRPANVVAAGIPQIVADGQLGGWFVIKGKWGWLFGSRAEAVRAAREFVREQ